MLITLLERRQEELLTRLVREARRMPRERRRAFYLAPRPGGRLAYVSHPDAVEPIETEMMDMEVLIASGLLLARPTGSGTLLVDVAPQGYRHQARLSGPAGKPVQTVDGHIQNHLNAHPFRNLHPEAHRKWQAAEAILGMGESEAEVATVGRLCHEILDAYSRGVALRKPASGEVAQAESVKRLTAVLEAHGGKLSPPKRLFLAALLGHWQSMDAQFRGRSHERRALTWYDAHRFVFVTATAMYVIDEALG